MEEYNSGIHHLNKNSTKVVAPPGGRSNFSLFGGDEPEQKAQLNVAQTKRNKSSIFDPPDAPQTTTSNNNKSGGGCSNPVTDQGPSSQAAPTTSAPTTALPGNEHVPPPVENATAPSGGRASTKVMAPPGGKTSINLFG